MFKTITKAITFTFLAQVCSGQDFQQEFSAAIQGNDTLKQREILTQWEKSEPGNPELLVSYFNYYYLLSKKEMITLTAEPPVGESLSIADSTGQTAGYIGSDLSFDRDVFQKAINKIDEGITLYPDRLDMRFGKIYVLGKTEDWEAFTDEIITTVRYSAQNKNKWKWTSNEEVTDGELFFLTALQDYQVELYNTGNDELLDNMREIASEILNHYPDHVESITNIGITYMLTEEYDKALGYLKKAGKIAPKDDVVISNIAYSYKMKGDKKKAIKYYKKLQKFDDPGIQEFAGKQIKELN